MPRMSEFATPPAGAPEDASIRLQPQATPEPTPVAYPHGTGVGPFTAVLWDLDGTIADSAPGIVDAISQMLDNFGLPIPSYDELLSYVGPPILDTFRKNGLDDAVELELAMQTYRDYYRESGEAMSVPYDGVLDLIRDLRAAGMPQSTATSKPEGSATRILELFGIAGELDFLTGATEDEQRSAKKDVVAEALRRLGQAGVDLSNVLMIGDRVHDVEGSAANGVPCCYVAWGYGRLGEERGSSFVATTADELRSLLGVPRRAQ